MERLQQAIFIASITAAFVVVLAWTGKMESELAYDDHRHHCEMVRIWNESKGEYGHPNYDGREC